jgi:hypothetical protein
LSRSHFKIDASDEILEDYRQAAKAILSTGYDIIADAAEHDIVALTRINHVVPGGLHGRVRTRYLRQGPIFTRDLTIIPKDYVTPCAGNKFIVALAP